MEDAEKLIIIGTLFTSVVLLIAGILVMLIQKKRISARQELHEASIRHEREKHQNEILVQERTLRDLGKTLHDDFGPVLTSLGVYLEVVKHGVPVDTDPKIAHSLSSMKDSITETKKKIRNTSRILYPVNLEKYGLVEAIDALAAGNSGQFPIEVKFHNHVPANSNFGQVRNIVIYRLVQELLHNAVKYAQASKVDILLSADDKQVTLNFKDNGIGLPENVKSDGLGLAMSGSRVESLNGTFTIVKGEQQEGAAFEIKIPLNDNDD